MTEYAKLMPRSTSSDVCIVTVTYGDRVGLLRPVVRSVMCQAPDSSLVVVDNGAGEETRRFLANLTGEKIHVVHLRQNQGSAVGFGAGLEAALSSACKFVWLLDDDTEPAEGALSSLLRTMERMDVVNPKPVLFSVRPARAGQVRVLEGGAGPEFPSRHAFGGFDFVQSLKRQFRRRRAGVFPYPELVAVPYGPYGGLFAEAATLAAVGLPDRMFGTYDDDLEFTFRLTERGHPLYLVSSSQLTESEQSWSLGDDGNRFRRLVETEHRELAAIAVRNRILFEEIRYAIPGWRRDINRLMFMMLLRAHGRLSKAPSWTAALLRTVKEARSLAGGVK